MSFPPLENPNLEGYEIARQLWIEYYNQREGTFVARKNVMDVIMKISLLFGPLQ